MNVRMVGKQLGLFAALLLLAACSARPKRRTDVRPTQTSQKSEGWTIMPGPSLTNPAATRDQRRSKLTK